MSRPNGSSLDEIAARIDTHLKRFEADPTINKNSSRALFGDDTYYKAFAAHYAALYPRTIFVSYAGHGAMFETRMSRREAEAYLAWLDAGNVGKHHAQQRAERAQ